MNVSVRYFSRSGNTEKVAQAIAEALGVTAIPVGQKPSAAEEAADILFIGAAAYAFGIDDAVKNFLGGLDSAKVKKVVLFSTSALVKNMRPHIEKALAGKNIPLAEKTFHSWGEFKFTRKGHPNQQDLADAKAFAKGVASAG